MSSNSWFKAEQFNAAKGGYEACYKKHPALEINGFKIYGGSCSSPVVKDADIYIGLDRTMINGLAPPWTGGVEYLYPITDMHAPSTASDFKLLVEWLCNQLHEGKKIHVGCIGGHGRTGTLLAALVMVATGEVDAINFVRKNYCEKAVESKSQIEFLHKQYGIQKVEPTKGVIASVTSAWEGHTFERKKGKGSGSTFSDVLARSKSGVTRIDPTLHTDKNIWAKPQSSALASAHI